MDKTNRYTAVAIWLHWIAALIMIFMVFFGEELMEAAEEGEAATSFLPSLHVTLGSAILILAVLRLVWRLANPPPPLPATMKPWELAMSKATHVIFYVLMIGLPVMGWLAIPEFMADEPTMPALSAFGLGLPTAPDLGLPAGDIHEIGSKVAMALIALHILAALKHQFIDRDGLLKRMSPH